MIKRVTILHKEKLLEDIEGYKLMFPTSYTTYDELYNTLRDHADEYENSGVFGHSVSGEWLDKCYGFEQQSNTEHVAVYKYVGIWKC